LSFYAGKQKVKIDEHQVKTDKHQAKLITINLVAFQGVRRFPPAGTH
jgi:hypothetical protein